MNKRVYIGMSADLIHHGHINIIEAGRKLGKVTIGLLTDGAIASYKRVPYLSFDQRKVIIENIKGVDEVIAQETLDYTQNLVALKPDYVIHGDDWITGIQSATRQKVIDTLKDWNGQLIEIAYTKSISSTLIQQKLHNAGATAQQRLKHFKQLLSAKTCIQAMEAYDAISSLVVENTGFTDDSGMVKSFDAIWFNGSTAIIKKEKPGIATTDAGSVLQTLNIILEQTTKPVLFDAGNMTSSEHFSFIAHSLERLGVSAIVTGGPAAAAEKISMENILENVKTVKKSRISADFMILTGLEITDGAKMQDELFLESTAMLEAGADGLLIYTTSARQDSLLAFANQYHLLEKKIPLLMVQAVDIPFSLNDSKQANIAAVIYEKLLIRSAFSAMEQTALHVLQHGHQPMQDKIFSSINFSTGDPSNTGEKGSVNLNSI